MTKEKKLRDQQLNLGIRKEQLLFKIERNGVRSRGMYCQDIIEAIPSFEKAPCETVFHGKNNSSIVLGRDRPASLASGYGGGGFTQCGMIDLVAGRAASYTNDDGDTGPPDADVYTGPNFFSDAARVYISQKCNIDEYFGLAMGSEGLTPLGAKSTSRGRSGIGIKADHVRIIGRRHIKIITGRAHADGMDRQGEKNSVGGEMSGGPGGIDFIVGNYTEPERQSLLSRLTGLDKFGEESVPKLQPLVKGDNLIEYLEQLQDMIVSTQALAMANAKGVAETAGSLGSLSLMVVPPNPGIAGATLRPVIQSIQSFMTTVQAQFNNMAQTANYLNHRSPRYICSRHVRTT